MIVLRIVLTIICMAMIGYLIYDEKKMRQMRQLTVGEALKTLAWYCMKHDCDDCKLHIDNECFSNKTPCDWVIIKGGKNK